MLFGSIKLVVCVLLCACCTVWGTVPRLRRRTSTTDLYVMKFDGGKHTFCRLVDDSQRVVATESGVSLAVKRVTSGQTKWLLSLPECPSFGNGPSTFDGDVIHGPELPEAEGFGLWGTTTVGWMNKWTDNIVPYTISTELDDGIKSKIFDAMHTIQSTTCIMFRNERVADRGLVMRILHACKEAPPEEEPTTIEKLECLFKDCDDEPSDCYKDGISYVMGLGMLRGGSQVYLHPDATTGVILHELLHALGIPHEQTRPDRDDYIDIQWANIIDSGKDQFRYFSHVEAGNLKYDYVATTLTPYDYNSIMHYHSYAYSKLKNMPTMYKKGTTELIYGNTELSSNDITGLQRFYRCVVQSEGAVTGRTRIPGAIPCTSKNTCVKGEGPCSEDDHCASGNVCVHEHGPRGFGICRTANYIPTTFHNPAHYFQIKPHSDDKSCIAVSEDGTLFEDKPCTQHDSWTWINWRTGGILRHVQTGLCLGGGPYTRPKLTVCPTAENLKNADPTFICKGSDYVFQPTKKCLKVESKSKKIKWTTCGADATKFVRDFEDGRRQNGCELRNWRCHIRVPCHATKCEFGGCGTCCYLEKCTTGLISYKCSKEGAPDRFW